MADNSFYYDGSLCMACRGCQVACKQWNGLAAEETSFFAAAGGYQNPASLSASTWTLLRFHEVADGDGVQWLFRREHCMHCTEAKCIEACPVQPDKAMVRTEQGTVTVNEEACIGCGACAAACPYGVPHIDEADKKCRKCTGCVDRVASGQLPSCVSTCCTGAMGYGSREEVVAKAQARAEALKKAGCPDVTVYGVGEQGGLHSICVLPGPIEAYGIEVAEADMDRVRHEARRAWAAWKAQQPVPVRAAATPGLAAAAVGGLVAAGLNKLAQRKAEIASDD